MDTNTMSEKDYKVLETRLRNTARRRGMRLSKNRVRDDRAPDYGTYGLSDLYTNTLTHGNPNTGYGLDLDQVAEILDGGTE